MCFNKMSQKIQRETRLPQDFKVNFQHIFPFSFYQFSSFGGCFCYNLLVGQRNKLDQSERLLNPSGKILFKTTPYSVSIPPALQLS